MLFAKWHKLRVFDNFAIMPKPKIIIVLQNNLTVEIMKVSALYYNIVTYFFLCSWTGGIFPSGELRVDGIRCERDESSSVIFARNHFAAFYEWTHERFALQNRNSYSLTVVNVKGQNPVVHFSLLLVLFDCMCISQSFSRHCGKLYRLLTSIISETMRDSYAILFKYIFLNPPCRSSGISANYWMEFHQKGVRSAQLIVYTTHFLRAGLDIQERLPFYPFSDYLETRSEYG